MACPICGRAAGAAYRPFCSRRCADVDLGRWLTGAYAIPATDAQDPASPDDAPNDAADDMRRSGHGGSQDDRQGNRQQPDKPPAARDRPH